ncbi:NADAR family protein [Candidatus Protochlamydia phocaeensis]|uniref:NADAR family protein n=1 Tax=Candidatus Protochlamydia phocaeensis TaxID=1414722 RepID=UPI0008399E53|nr:NADAR family protein [Candidatus Protochlamydia phocaeensis]
MQVNLFTSRPFSVEYNSQHHVLDKKDVNKIILATAIGSLFFLVGGLVAFLGASYYFRQRKVQELTGTNNPHLQRISQVRNRNLLTPSNPVASSLKTVLTNEMNRTMGKHLRDNQRATLVSLFDQALQSPQPRQTLEALINGKINQPDGWGAAKAAHIRTNLLPHVPLSNANPSDSSSFPSSAIIQQTQVRAIAQAPINPQGTKLVCFYKSGPTEFLGNFAICPHGIQLWGHTFKCSEAAFQWRKYYLAAQNNNHASLLNDPKMREFFTCDGEKAFQLNRELERKYPNVFASNWRNGVRDQVMWDVLNAKFQQNPELTQLLQDTQGAYLLEHNQATRDNYWSDNSNGTGKNMLGKMLMAIRDSKPCPPPDDTSDQMQVQAFASYANQPRSLNYQIF